MPLHCNKERKTGHFKAFHKTFFFLIFLSFSVSAGSKAQTSTIPVALTFGTANYTRCDTLKIQIQVSTDKTFSNIVNQSNWITCQRNANFIYAANLPPLQGIFYWRGRHQDGCSGKISAWSSPFKLYLLLDPSKLVAGDVNADGFLNLLDLIYLIEYFFEGGLPPTPPQVGDANCDSKCTVTDLIILLNYLWKFGPPPCTPLLKPLSPEQSSLSSQPQAK